MKVYEVLPNLLVRGEFHKRSRKLEELKELGVDVVYCLLRRRDEDLVAADLEGRGPTYLQFPLSDGQEVLVDRVVNVVRPVLVSLRLGERVLVHCIGAKNRTGLVAALCLMAETGCTGQEAFERYREIRGKVGLNNSVYEKWLRGLKCFTLGTSLTGDRGVELEYV